MQQVTYNMLFCWFVGPATDVPVWDVTVFTKNRDRLLEGDIARGFLLAMLADPQVTPLLSSEHFSVDGTLIEAWAAKSFRPKSRPSGLTRGTAAATRRRRAATESATFVARPAAMRRTPQGGGRSAQDAPSRHRAGGLDVHLRCRGLQSGPEPEAADWRGVVMRGVCPEA